MLTSMPMLELSNGIRDRLNELRQKCRSQPMPAWIEQRRINALFRQFIELPYALPSLLILPTSIAIAGNYRNAKIIAALAIAAAIVIWLITQKLKQLQENNPTLSEKQLRDQKQLKNIIIVAACALALSALMGAGTLIS